MGNTNAQMKLNNCFHCYESSFSPAITRAGNDFLGTDLTVKLVSASYEPAFFWRDNDYFATQINHTKEFSVVLKVSTAAANLMFLEALGQRQQESGYLDFKEISELEIRILTAYIQAIYDKITPLFLDRKEINSILHTVQNEKLVYLTFYISGDKDVEAGKIILSFPGFIFRKMEKIEPSKTLVGYDFFTDSSVETDILIGKTRASLDDLKGLEPDDVIMLDNSDLYRMYLKQHRGDNLEINVNPSHSLVLDLEDENGVDDIVNETKDSNANIWDSLEVDVNASFEKIKMKLGDLREITEGLVVDVASMAENKVYIEVENRHLATGELVIIGDKYGVRITEINREAKSREVGMLKEQAAEAQKTGGDEESDAIAAPVDDEDLEIQEDIDDEDFEIDDDEEEDEDLDKVEDDEEEEY